MSADNWGECPKCGKGDNTKHIHADNPHFKSRFEKHGINHQGAPLREDWEIGIADGELFIDYDALCYCCGYAKNFKYSEAA